MTSMYFNPQLIHTHTHQPTALIYLAWEIGIVTKFLVEVATLDLGSQQRNLLTLCSITLHHSVLSDTVKKRNYWTWNGELMSVSFSLAITSQVVLQETFGTCQLLVLVSSLILLYWRMLLSIQVVMTVVMGVLYWKTLHSTEPQWLTTMAACLVQQLVLSVIGAVSMDWIQQPLRESAKMMDYGLEVPSHVVCPYNNV